MTVAFSTSPRFVEHITGPHHPERPDRIRAICRAVRDAGLVQSPDPFPEFVLNTGIKPLGLPPLLELTPTPADEAWLSLVHPPTYVEFVRRTCAAGGVLDLGDTPVHPGSFEIALLSLGSLLGCCDAVMTGLARRAFSAARPPGHHAEPDRPMGFCLFSNVAIAARYLQKQYGLQRVAIVDFDVHHGNGTQAAFERDPSVLFISTHQNPRTCYPGSGYDWEIGVDVGRQHTLNIPLNPGSGDDELLAAYHSRVLPALDAFAPQALLISAGFDAHADDPLAELQWSDAGFDQITRLLVGIAEKHCAGRVISALEGGYNLRALGRGVVRHLVALADEGRGSC